MSSTSRTPVGSRAVAKRVLATLTDDGIGLLAEHEVVVAARTLIEPHLDHLRAAQAVVTEARMLWLVQALIDYGEEIAEAGRGSMEVKPNGHFHVTVYRPPLGTDPGMNHDVMTFITWVSIETDANSIIKAEPVPVP